MRAYGDNEPFGKNNAEQDASRNRFTKNTDERRVGRVCVLM